MDAMPRFFFEFDGNEERAEDEGVELASLKDAIAAAAASLGTTLAEHRGSVEGLSATIRDDDGPKARLSLSCDVVRLGWRPE